MISRACSSNLVSRSGVTAIVVLKTKPKKQTNNKHYIINIKIYIADAGAIAQQ